MSPAEQGQLRRGQVITTYGPGALIDLPGDSAVVAGVDTWPSDLEEIHEPRLAHKLRSITGVHNPRLYAPPPAEEGPRPRQRGIVAYRFPEWCLVQEAEGQEDRERSRRLVNRRSLDQRSRFDGRPVIPTRFVRACPRGHVEDLPWYTFVHGPDDTCRKQLWLDERGTSGDLAELFVRCACGKQRNLYEATVLENWALGTCGGVRIWLGRNTAEDCGQPARLLIRTASNAYFPQVVSVLSLPDVAGAIEVVVKELWDDLGIVQQPAELSFVKRKPDVAARLARFSDDEILGAIKQVRGGATAEKPVKQVELGALIAAPEGFGEDIPVNPDFHARKLPDDSWRGPTGFRQIESIVQVHRLREVMALIGFTRLEAVIPDIQGEFETDVERAQIALEPQWFPAVENRGEGLFILLRTSVIQEWLRRPAVIDRLQALASGHSRWLAGRKTHRQFPGGPYVLLHTLSHLLVQSLAMRCGYPASSIRERIYADSDLDRYGVLLYTASSDAEGTLGGLVQQARHIREHLRLAFRSSMLCSNDPICAQHTPGQSMEGRWLHGAACHGCALIAETSCEMRNDYLDRALVVPVLGVDGAAFFDPAR